MLCLRGPGYVQDRSARSSACGSSGAYADRVAARSAKAGRENENYRVEGGHGRIMSRALPIGPQLLVSQPPSPPYSRYVRTRPPASQPANPSILTLFRTIHTVGNPTGSMEAQGAAYGEETGQAWYMAQLLSPVTLYSIRSDSTLRVSILRFCDDHDGLLCDMVCFSRTPFHNPVHRFSGAASNTMAMHEPGAIPTPSWHGGCNWPRTTLHGVAEYPFMCLIV
ncbi:hypothetical protein C8Q78DRAFT_12210 [Trametes maxima]|nr:hypothetical protein C8Q78DRAFT_12210 [Trametes maxima]